MHRLIYLVVFFACLNVNASGIDTIPFTKIDSLTYSLYLKGDWTNLKSVGNKLLEHKIDWYYLRLRLAEAELQLNHPSFALKHIEKAENFSGRSDLTNALLVRSSLLFNQYRRALLVATRDTSSYYSHFLKQNRLFKESEMEGVFKRSANAELGSLTGFRLGVNSYVGRRFSFYLSGQYYAQTNTKRDSLNKNAKVDINQSQFYSKIFVVCSSRISAFLGGQISSTTIGSTTQKNYIAFGGVEIFKPFVKYKFSAALTDFNSTDKIITSLTVTAFPLANNTFYPWIGVSNIYDADSLTDISIVDIGLGGKLANNLWADIFVTPMHYDFHTLNDYEVTFNLQDRVNFKIGGGLSYYGIKNITIKANYILEYMRIAGIPQIKNYTQNTITLCLSWYR